MKLIDRIVCGGTLLAVAAMIATGPLAVKAQEEGRDVATAIKSGVLLVDGDTIKVNGERIRIIEIDAPETWKPRCENELVLGLKAKQRLRELLDGVDDAHPLTVVPEGYDYWHRTLAYVYVGEVNVGQQLLDEGHALPYVAGPQAKAKRLATWCGSASQNGN